MVTDRLLLDLHRSIAAGMRSRTAVRKRPTAPAGRGNEQALPQVNPSVVRLAELEPAPSSSSEIDGQAPCCPAFALVVRLRKSYKDGVNCGPLQVAPYGSSGTMIHMSR
jgi:hypothetical protein